MNDDKYPIEACICVHENAMLIVNKPNAFVKVCHAHDGGARQVQKWAWAIVNCSGDYFVIGLSPRELLFVLELGGGVVERFPTKAAAGAALANAYAPGRDCVQKKPESLHDRG